MSLFIALNPGEALARVALSALMQTTVVIVLAALVARVALRQRADARHGLLLGTLVWVLISPAVAALADRSERSLGTLAIPLPSQATTAAIRKPSLDVVSEPATEHSRDNAPVETEALDDATVRGAQQVKVREPIAANSASPIPTWRGSVLLTRVALIWLIGVLIGLARMILGCHRLAALLRDTSPLDPGRHGETLAQVRDALGVATLPPIASSARAREPVAIGLFRPLVVLPEGLAEVISNDALRQILVHECAHILRRDPLVGLLQRLAGVLYWLHPLVHHLNAQLTQAREEVCDNHVLQSGDRYSYARTLLALTQMCRPAGVVRPGLGLLGVRWSLADRVAGLLDPRRVTMTRTTVRMKIVLVFALAATGLTATRLRIDRPARADETDAKQTASPVALPNAAEAATWGVKGIVVDEQGRPVPGVVVRSVPNEGDPDEARSAADGSFAMDLQPNRPFIRGVVAELESGTRVGIARFEVVRDASSLDPVKIVLKPSRAVLVRVKDAAGAPVPGAAVEALDFSFQVRAVAGPDGIATLRIPADAQVQWVIGLKPRVGFDYFENSRTRPPTEIKPLPTELTLTLDGAQSIHIKAIDSRNQPVPGVAFSPWTVTKKGKIGTVNFFRSVISMATTDRAGEAVFDWFPKDFGGSFRVRSSLYTCPNPPRHEPSGPTELTFRLLRDTRLSGTVRLADGSPVSQVLVKALGNPRFGRGIVGARTGAVGRYSLDVAPEGSYVISVEHPTWAGPSLLGIVVHEGQPRDGLDFNVSRGTLLHGQLTEGPDRQTVAGAEVTLVEEGSTTIPKEVRSAQVPRRVYTDSRGRYQFRIGPGRYWLMTPPLSGNESLMLEVNAENEIVRDLVLKGPAEGSFFNGVVVQKTNAGDRPVPNARVWACGVASSPGMASLTDAEGKIRMLRTPGEHTL